METKDQPQTNGYEPVELNARTVGGNVTESADKSQVGHQFPPNEETNDTLESGISLDPQLRENGSDCEVEGYASRQLLPNKEREVDPFEVL